MQDNLLARIQNWYKSHCNGDWEHRYGISIGNLDNPGWTIKIDLAETSLENLKFERTIDNGTLDWLFIKTKDNVLEASCDPNKLTTVFEIFLDEIIPNYADENFRYNIFIVMKGASANVWRPAKAKMLTEDTMEIVEIPALKYENIKIKNIKDINFSQEDITTFTTRYSVGDKVKTELVEMFDGVTLVATE